MGVVVGFEVQGAGKIPAAQEKNAAATEKLNKKLKSTGKNWKTAGAEAKKYDRLAQQLARRNETAQEKYNRKLREAQKALAGNARESELLKRETTRLRIEFLKSQAEDKKAIALRRQAAQEKKAQLAAEIRAEKERVTAAKNRFREISRSEKAALRESQRAQKEARATRLREAKKNFNAIARSERRALAGRKKELAEFEKNSISAFSAKRVLAYGASFLTVQTALQAITGEIQKQQELIDKASEAKLTVSQSRNVVLRNTISQTPAERQRILAASQQLAADTGVSEVAINAGLAQALSASGGKVDASLEATKIAAKFLADRPGEIGEAAGSLLDLSKVTGTNDGKTNLGLLTKVGELGRVVDPRLQAQNVAPALIGAQSFGGTARGSGALFAALSNAGADVTGRRTGTGQISLAAQLSKFDFGLGDADKSRDEKANEVIKSQQKLEKARANLASAEQSQSKSTATAQLRLDRVLEDRELAVARARKSGKKLTKSQQLGFDRRITDARSALTEAGGGLVDERRVEVEAAADNLQVAERAATTKSVNAEKIRESLVAFQGSNLTQRIKRLQSNPELARQFLADASFEKKVLGPIRDLLLSPNSQSASEFERNLGLIPGNAGLSAVGTEALGVFSANSLEPVAVRKRAIDNAAERSRVGKSSESLSTEERAAVEEILVNSGLSSFSTKLNTFLTGTFDSADGLSRNSAVDLLRGRSNQLGRQLQAGGGNFLQGEDREQAISSKNLLDELAAKLNGKVQLEESKKQTAALEALVDKEGGLVGGPQ